MIEVQQLTKRYGRKKVLQDVSFTAEKGKVTCLIGINGVGKSTILKGIMGLVPISSGRILVDGQPMQPKLYEKVSFIPDTMTMPPRMKIQDAMRFMKDFYSRWNEERAKQLLEFFRLGQDERVSDLSKGNAAKLNLLLGLSLDADYLLMDEPFSGIDMFSREQIVEVFTSHLMDDRGVIITTHEIQDVEHLIDKAVLLNEGRVLKQFQVEEVRLHEGKSVVDVMREVYQP
ncbi:ABC transporter ATP-binding protein [Xylanibacillus composti]|uniref:Multidrug ABC transporter ATP-binding protein n=1 Tax=Xylanibacillus composti TaxID=1572762 RepID=A0A8J4H9G8_9BACL|nr:ABC transporter ATP-binding protein [Xylanibacillus composti]MDT9726870.1 ABC transporter ATP-binding protein [Xylanibacillus composti]GIQ71358.1 multidrug ABC transporter ATP-binding protein [Xylanibacillus composti]